MAEQQVCKTCDRADCPREDLWQRVRSHDFDCPCTACEAYDEVDDECQKHAVDWRERALAAEAKLKGDND